MPISKSTLEKHTNPTFIETGTYHGETVAVAVDLGFKTIYSVDINNDFAASVKSRHAKNPNVHVSSGDSEDMLRSVLPKVRGPITFWLDAHALVTPMTHFQMQFPLLRELFAIKRFAPSGKHTILIDDLRTFNEEDTALLLKAVKELWPGCKVSYEDGIQTDDVLCVRLA